MSAGSDLGDIELASLLAGCVRHLHAVWNESTALFPYSTRLVDGRYVNNYDHPDAVRYTINSLLGLSAISRAGTHGVESSAVAASIGDFVDRQGTRVVTCADAGLLTLLLVEHDSAHGDLADAMLEGVRRHVSDPRSLNMQDLAWGLWGACGAARAGVAGAEDVARAIFSAMRHDFVSTSSGLKLPRHATSRYRRDIVSFGSLVYFLRAMHEFAVTFDDDQRHSSSKTESGTHSRSRDREESGRG